jgi:hypothetical protein
MGQIRVSFGEVMALSGRTRSQMEYCLRKLGPAVRPERVGFCLFFSPADVSVILRALAQIKTPKRFLPKQGLSA